MTPRRFWSAFALVLLSTFAALAADDPYGDPIPDGAKARLGTARMRNSYGTTPSVITPDGKFLAGGSSNGGVAYIDPATGKTSRTVKIDGAFGTPVAFSADGKRGANASFDSAFVWSTDNGKVLAKIMRPTSVGDNAMSLSAEGKRVAIGGNRRDKEKGPTVVVWDVDENKQVSLVSPVQNDSAFVALSRDGKRLATWGYHYDRDAKGQIDPDKDPSRQVQFWDATTGKETAKVRVPGGYTTNVVVFSPDGAIAAAATGNGSIHLFDPATGAAKGMLLGRSGQGRKLAFSPDGKTLAAGGDDGSIQRWTVSDRKRTGTTEPPASIPYGLRGITFADNERVVVWANRGTSTVVWESPSGKVLSPTGGHTAGIRGATVSGQEILTAGDDGVILRWNPATGKELGVLTLYFPGRELGSGAVTNPATLSPDGKLAMVTDGASAGLALHDLPSGRQQFILPGDFGRDSRGTFNADGTKVVQVRTSFDVKKNPAHVAVWDVAAAKKLGEVELPGIGYASGSITPDGKTLITVGIKQDEKGNAEFFVTGWELATGKKLAEYKEAGGFGTGYVVAMGDNKSAVVVTPKGPVAVIDATTGKKVHEVDIGRGGQVAAAPVLSPDSKTLAIMLSGGFGPTATGTVLLVDMEANKVKKTLTGVSGNPSVLVFAPDGKTLITGSYDTTALVWDVSKP